jgi:hypothetical protein
MEVDPASSPGLPRFLNHPTATIDWQNIGGAPMIFGLLGTREQFKSEE